MANYRKIIKTLLIDFWKSGSESESPNHIINKVKLFDAVEKLSTTGWTITNQTRSNASFSKDGLILFVEEDPNGNLELIEIEADEDHKDLRLVEIKNVLRLAGTGADLALKDLDNKTG